jgi:hypothetical protein
MYNDPNQPQQTESSQQSPPPYPYGEPQPPYYQPQWGQQPPPQYAQTQYGAPYGAPPGPDYMQPQQPRQSRRWLWITLGIIGGLVVLSCIACGTLFALGIGFFAKTAGAPTSVVDQYYNAIENQKYDTAYSYLDPNLIASNGQPLTQQEYTTAAQAQDTNKGTVSSFSIRNISLNNGITSLIVSVKRIDAPAYDVHLQLRQEGSDWKITSYDGI